MRKQITLACLTIFLTTTSANAEMDRNLFFQSLNTPKTYGEIQGRVQNCTNQNLLENALLHVPGKSIATRISADGSFHLHWVPTGTYKLDLEIEDRQIGEVQNIPVKEGKVTHLNSIEVCVTEKEKKGIIANTSTIKKASKIRCPKGGFTCSSSWHNIKAKKSEARESEINTREQKRPPVYSVSEGFKLIQVQ